jgi:Undecaprenyl-phosphate glucose phosphotransferase
MARTPGIPPGGVHPQSAVTALRRHGPLTVPLAVMPLISGAVDGVLILACAIGSDFLYHQFTYARMGDLQRSFGLGLMAAALFVVSANAQRLYTNVHRLGALRGGLRSVALTWLAVGAALTSIILLLKVGDALSRGMLLSFVATGLVALSLWRWLRDRIVLRLIIAGTLTGPRVAVLADLERRDRESQMRRLERYGFRISRLFFLPAKSDGDKDDERQMLATMQALIRHVRRQQVEEILIVADWSRFADNAVLRRMLAMVPVPAKFIVDTDLAQLLSFHSCEIGSAKALIVKPAALSYRDRASKRAFDIVAGSVLLLLLSPLFAAVALAVRLDSKGPVFFRQWRGGFNGRRFRIVKFRTMSVAEDGAVVQQARRGDPRVTRLGRILRSTSLDELPQLINVIIGDMSLVGPRPHALAHDQSYGEAIAPYQARHNVKPGITGWAQVNGCRGETSEVHQMQRRVDLDLDYIRRWSLALDIGIIMRTISEVLFRRNAY